jgi:FkbM family methyltransferase
MVASAAVIIDGVRFEGRSYALSAFDDDHISRWLETGRFYEEDLLRAVRDLNVEGSYVDVGAFIGTHAVFFANECRATKVYAIEPASESYELLVENVQRHGNNKIMAFRAAVHDTWRTAKTERLAEANRGMTITHEGGSIPVLQLDAMEINAALIKIDVEGYEMSVLRSAARTIVAKRPVIVAEAYTEDRRNAIDQYLEPLDYCRSRAYGRTPTYLWTPA